MKASQNFCEQGKRGVSQRVWRYFEELGRKSAAVL